MLALRQQVRNQQQALQQEQVLVATVQEWQARLIATFEAQLPQVAQELAQLVTADNEWAASVRRLQRLPGVARSRAVQRPASCCIWSGQWAHESKHSIRRIERQGSSSRPLDKQHRISHDRGSPALLVQQAGLAGGIITYVLCNWRPNRCPAAPIGMLARPPAL